MTRHFPGSGMLFDCGRQTLEAYAGETPALDLRTYFRGRLTAAGVFIGLSGCVERRFVIDVLGTWDGDRGTLTERFRFADGEVTERIWTVGFLNGGAFTATAPDVEGSATGRQCGNAAAMRYRLRIPRTRGAITVTMDDWLYLMDDGTLINRARMAKFGIKVGELVVAFRRDDGGAAAPPGGA